MKDVYKFVQKKLKKDYGYEGPINGEVDVATGHALNRIFELDRTGWDRSRKANAVAQMLLNDDGAKLVVDGIWGHKSQSAWAKATGATAPVPLSAVPGSGWMPGLIHDPRWNVDDLPDYAPKGIVLHRTAGHYATGDYSVGKWGHSGGITKKGKSLGFHVLIGKEQNQVIQFVPSTKRVNHVKAWSGHFFGIELSGDVGMWKDGYVNGEPLTAWQIETVVKVIKWVAGMHGIPKVECTRHDEMHKMGVFDGLVGHRDLTSNDHADSPNKADWATIMSKLK